jgi:hypothetical protein
VNLNSNHQSLSDSCVPRRDETQFNAQVIIMSQKHDQNNREDYFQQQTENSKFYQQQFQDPNNLLNQSQSCLSPSILQPDLIQTTGLNEHNFSSFDQSYLQNMNYNS